MVTAVKEKGQKKDEGVVGGGKKEIEQKDLFGKTVGGKKIAETNVTVRIPKVIPQVTVRRDGSLFTYTKEGVRGQGSTLAEAETAFKKAYGEKI